MTWPPLSRVANFGFLGLFPPPKVSWVGCELTGDKNKLRFLGRQDFGMVLVIVQGRGRLQALSSPEP